MRLILILLISILPACVHACLWDRDTLAEEAKANLDTVKAITGWFNRYPPKYYEMRLERVIKEITADPKRLDLYDDAGVACSRLGQHTKAIAWMMLKKAVLDALPQDETTAEARYRYLSNTGTFHLIRWMTTPEENRYRDHSDLREADKLIAAAIELNPGAHFGREKFQLMLIRWLLDPALDPKALASSNFLGQETLYNRGRGKPEAPHAGDFTYEEATKGITGLIQLGAAWQSIDTIYALQTSLGGEHNNYLAELAMLRRKELIAAGGASLHPSESIRAMISEAGGSGMIYSPRKIAAFYQEATTAAAKREAAWLAYQQERFAKGEHPDTHPQFWNAWQEPTFPKFPMKDLKDMMDRDPAGIAMLFIIAAAIAILALIIVTVLARAKRRRKQVTPVSA